MRILAIVVAALLAGMGSSSPAMASGNKGAGGKSSQSVDPYVNQARQLLGGKGDAKGSTAGTGDKRIRTLELRVETEAKKLEDIKRLPPSPFREQELVRVKRSLDLKKKDLAAAQAESRK
jgi:hypothetical protein